jgi:hypothetical protein
LKGYVLKSSMHITEKIVGLYLVVTVGVLVFVAAEAFD